MDQQLNTTSDSCIHPSAGTQRERDGGFVLFMVIILSFLITAICKLRINTHPVKQAYCILFYFFVRKQKDAMLSEPKTS